MSRIGPASAGSGGTSFVVFVRHRLSMFRLRAWFRKSYHGAIWPNIRRMRVSRLSSSKAVVIVNPWSAGLSASRSLRIVSSGRARRFQVIALRQRPGD